MTNLYMKTILVFLIFSFSVFNSLQAVAECKPAQIADKYLIFTRTENESEARTKTSHVRMTVIRKNIASGGLAGSERYIQHLVRLVDARPISSTVLGFPSIRKKSIDSIEILTVVCDDSDTNRVAFTVPFFANTDYLYRGVAFYDGNLKDNKVIEGISSFHSPIPSKALKDSGQPDEFSDESDFVALPN